jgi:hypothetical protein
MSSRPVAMRPRTGRREATSAGPPGNTRRQVGAGHSGRPSGRAAGAQVTFRLRGHTVLAATTKGRERGRRRGMVGATLSLGLLAARRLRVTGRL